MSLYKDCNCNMTSTPSLTQDLPEILANMSAASLYVGDLLPHINEVILFKKFSPLGTVTSVKLCRDWVTAKSLCYAYVNFENPAEAEKAYRTLNYELLEGQPMRIMKSTRNPWLGSNSCCYQHQHQHQHQCCSGGSPSNAFNNKSLVDAKSLVEAIEIYSRAVKVTTIAQTLALQESTESKAPTGYKYSSDFLKRMNNQNKFTNVFIRNFRDLLDDYKLERLCRQFGEVVSVKVMVDEYGISKGFGFACFNDSDDAQRAVYKLNGLVLDGRTLYAGPAMTRSQRSETRPSRYDNEDFRPQQQQQQQQEYRPQTVSSRICIRNLRDLVDDIRLYKEFQRFGTVLHAEVLKTSDGRPKGSGFVDFKDKADAARALNSMNGKAFYGTRIAVTYVPHTNTVSTNTISHEHPFDDDYSNKDWDETEKDGSRRHDVSTATCTSNDGDNNSSSSRNNNLLQLKNIASSLADKGHPINIKDIGNFNSTSVNRNSREIQKYRSVYTTVSTNNSNNSDINTSNNASLTSGKDSEDTVGGARKDEAAEATASDVTAQPDDADDTSTSATLCVKNLDESISDEKLENLFTTFGTILSAKVISNEFGISKGFGFVIMSEAQDAVKAIKSLDGRIVVNRPIYVAPAAQQARPAEKE